MGHIMMYVYIYMYCEFAMFVQTFHEIAMMFAYIYIYIDNQERGGEYSYAPARSFAHIDNGR